MRVLQKSNTTVRPELHYTYLRAYPAWSQVNQASKLPIKKLHKKTKDLLADQVEDLLMYAIL
jgi:hypothetical protein